ncbi:conjugal transfer protein TraL [Oxalobacteraceae bacterium R-40]|uniref:Conjugal transfer protein TraL n=1 Tax=Keguizhuia sedimenti TaxID=3064264 RepID=A0ABU1BVC9_9BURK|nr:conjugal transfer protein TraL [Oxalobacteraceae bacterium R-40]
MAIHMIKQGKGGVGKSLIAAMLAQWLLTKDEPLYCADTDPVNDTFSRYKALNVETIQLLDDQDNINTRNFDALIEKLIAHEGNAVIDNGASTFVALNAYMKENGIVELLQDAGKEIFVHTVVTGGQAFQDTLIGLNLLLKTQKAPVVVWENEYFGKVEKNGKVFRDSEIYKNNQERIKGLVHIEKRTEHTFGHDIGVLCSNNLTFEEALTSELFGMIPRSRLHTVRKSIFSQLDKLPL